MYPALGNSATSVRRFEGPALGNSATPVRRFEGPGPDLALCYSATPVRRFEGISILAMQHVARLNLRYFTYFESFLYYGHELLLALGNSATPVRRFEGPGPDLALCYSATPVRRFEGTSILAMQQVARFDIQDQESFLFPDPVEVEKDHWKNVYQSRD